MIKTLALFGYKARLGKWRAVLWFALLSALIGITQLGQPLDLSLKVLWNKARAQPVSGRVMVVGIDDEALSRVGAWPWTAAQLARFNDALFEAGAKRVFYDIPLLSIQDSRSGALRSSIDQHSGRVFISEALGTGANRDERAPAPVNDLAKHARIASTARWIQGYWNGVETIPYRREVRGQMLDSMESAISGVTGAAGDQFPIDYSYRASTVPYAGAAKILSDPKAATVVAGKDVVVGFNTQMVGVTLSVPGQTRQPSSLILVLGAETLMAGRPVVLGWLPTWLLALLAFWGSRRPKALRRLRIWAPMTIAAVLGLSFLAATLNIAIEVAPSLFFLAAVAIREAWRRFGAEQKTAGSINPISGLPTPNAVRHDDGLTGRLLVAARVRHFANVLSALPPNCEEALTRQIVSRLELAVGDGQLLHGDDGNFFWLADSAGFESIVEQFEALHVLFRAPVRIGDKTFDLDVSFGLDRELALPLSHRMVTALSAAHEAEREGICWKLHDPSEARGKEWLLSLLGELDQAIVSGRVWVAYQPKYDLRTRRMTGAEALVRWTHETRGPISPAEFVAAAERHGRIGKLTAFVLDNALIVAKQLVELDPAFQISVNISPSLLISNDIYEMVKSALDRHGLDPACLMLEVTETAAIAKEETAQLLMKRFREMGVDLSIDDYGTGLSTLEYLRKIPAAELKIDRQFTAELCSSDADRVVMHSTIQLAHALGMKAVAEGIETEEALQILTEMGCDIGQGYYLARPIDSAALLSVAALPENRTSAYG